MRLFSLGAELASRPNPRDTAYDVTPDGHFVMIKADERSSVNRQLNVVLNWGAELAQRVSTR